MPPPTRHSPPAPAIAIGPLLRLLPLLFALTFMAGCSTMDRGTDAARLLMDIQAGPEESALKRRTPAPDVQSLSYTVDGHHQVADLYQTPDTSRGTLVLIHGFTEAGRRDPRLVDFANSLARSGFRVLAPEVPGLTEMTVGSEERHEIAIALRYATRDGGKTGLSALSMAAGPAILAAMEEETADHVSYLLLIGPYYDIIDLIRFATTGVDAGGDQARDTPPPMEAGKWFLLLTQLHQFRDPADREALEAIAQRRMRSPQAPVDQYVGQLTAEGRAAFELITNTDPDRVQPLVNDLPASVRRELSALDLSGRDLGALKAHVLLVHGAEDPIIPVSHSRRLVRALPAEQTELFIPPNLSHVDIEPGLRDSLQLWQATRRLLTVAETGTGTQADHAELDR